MMIKKILTLLFVLNCCKTGFSQFITNGNLNGTLANSLSESSLPSGWQAVPHTDPNSKATSSITATPDLTSIIGPVFKAGLISLKLIGNPLSDSTFVSGLDASFGSTDYYHEGIQQTVTGFIPNTTYVINFYQTVVKQGGTNVPNVILYPALDTSGSWSFFLDNNLISTTNISTSSLPFNSLNLVWDLRSIQFTATSNSHTLKFLATDDDIISESFDNNGGLRMGIDNISLSTISPSFSSFTITQCHSYTVPSGDETHTSTGSYMDTIVNSVGADSIMTITVNINNSAAGMDIQTACDSYLWIDGNTYNSNNTTAKDTIIGGAFNGCDSIVTLNLSINNYITGTDTQTACDSYLWIDGNTYNSNNTTAKDTIIGGAFNGCDSIVTLNLSINNCDFLFEIPNIITPNQDGVNDLFKLSINERIISMTMEIYNRWGQLLYNSNQLNSGWDGYTNSGSQVASGTYFYVINIENENSIIKKYNGTLTLTR